MKKLIFILLPLLTLSLQAEWHDWTEKEQDLFTDYIALNLIDIVTKQADEYFGRANPAVPQTQTQLKQQRLVNNWLTTWTEAYQQMFALSLQYLSPEEIQRITIC